MKSKFIALMWATVVLAAVFVFSSVTALAQDEPLVVDEVIAQVNDQVITLSMVKRNMRDAVEALKQQGMSEQQATEEVEKHKTQMVVSLVNEQLLMEHGKELGIAQDVEDEVNRRLLEGAKAQGITSVEKLEERLRAEGIEPGELRSSLRAQIMKQAVLQREVDSKVYYNISADELKKYFEAHKDQFRKPESVTLSEIYLSFAGKTEADVKAKAEQIVAQARAGQDFGALAAANSEREENGKRTALETKGKVGTFQVPDLRPDLAASLKDIKGGGVTNPIRSDEGYQIIRVDERTAGSDVPTFNEEKVREAILNERAPKEREAYIQKLRNEAFIKFADPYKATYEPLLGLNSNANPATASKADKEKDKKNKKP
ncbi:MAG: peptidyl-prolyl cis-trans isomerase [Pyrinomonadaceae bacterium]